MANLDEEIDAVSKPIDQSSDQVTRAINMVISPRDPPAPVLMLPVLQKSEILKFQERNNVKADYWLSQSSSKSSFSMKRPLDDDLLKASKPNKASESCTACGRKFYNSTEDKLVIDDATHSKVKHFIN